MSLLKNVHEFDTRQNPTITVFDGSRDDECKLATQFWSTVVLVPPVESTLACKEIKQRTQSRPLNGGSNTRPLPATISKAMQAKAMRDKELEEIAAMKQAEDEQRRIQEVRQRQQQQRHLFYNQATNNRVKHQEWSVPPVKTYCADDVPYAAHTHYGEELDDAYANDDYDRQLVGALPD